MMKKAFMALFIASMLSIGMSAAEDDEAKTIVETAVEAGNFNTLVAAVEAAGLVDTLNGEGPFTVFAPTDEAFAALFESTEIDMNDTVGLAEVLKYHVASGALMAADIRNMTSIPTLQGGDLTVEVTEEGGVKVGGANVTAPDIVCSNGVIHVIDAVLMLPAEEEVAEEMPEETVEEPVDETTVEVEEESAETGTAC